MARWANPTNSIWQSFQKQFTFPDSISYHPAKIHWSNYGNWVPADVWLHTLVLVRPANKSTTHKPFSIIPKITFCFPTKRPHRCVRGILVMRHDCIWCHWDTTVPYDSLFIRPHIRHSSHAPMISEHGFGLEERMQRNAVERIFVLCDVMRK